MPRTVTVAAVALAAAAVTAEPAGAGPWSATAAQSSGVLTAATLSHRFTVHSGPGTGGLSFTVPKLLSGTTVSGVDLENTSTVPVVLSGTLTLQSFLVSTAVTVERCSTPWAPTGGCPGTSSSVMATGILTGPTSVTWASGPLPPDAAVHLKVTVGGSVSNTLTMTSSQRPARAPMDRTAA